MDDESGDQASALWLHPYIAAQRRRLLTVVPKRHCMFGDRGTRVEQLAESR